MQLNHFENKVNKVELLVVTQIATKVYLEK